MTFTLVKKCSKIKYLIHISDIHIRNNGDREEEYRYVFDRLIEKIEELEINNDYLFVITGDIFDSNKPDDNARNLAKELFMRLLEFTNVVSIIGNHECDMKNNSYKKENPLTSTIDGLTNKDNKSWVILESGEYKFGNIKFGLTCQEDENVFIPKKMDKNKYTYVGLGHFIIKEVFEKGDYKFKLEDFDDYDFVLLGDIHKNILFDKTRGYAGSLIQQRVSESITEHGFVLYNIEEKTNELIKIQNENAIINVKIENGNDDFSLIKFKNFKNLNVKIQIINSTEDDVEKFKNKLNDVYKFKIIGWDVNGEYKEKEIPNEIKLPIKSKEELELIMKNIVMNEIKFRDFLRIKNKIDDVMDNILIKKQNKCEIKLEKLEFENIFSYKSGKIDFTDFKNKIVSIAGNNNSGKTNLLNIIYFAIYGTCPKLEGVFNEKTRYQLIKKGFNDYSTSIEFKVDGVLYKIKRTGVLKKKSSKLKETIDIFCQNSNISRNGKKENEKLIEELVGDYDTALLESSMNCNNIDFINMEPKKRMEYINNKSGMSLLYEVMEIIKKRKNKKLTYSKKMVDGNDDFNIELLENNKNILKTKLDDKKIKRDEISKECRQIYSELCDKNNQIKNIIDLDLSEININILKEELQEIKNDINNIKSKLQKSKYNNIEKEYEVFCYENKNEINNYKNKINRLTKRLSDEKNPFENLKNELNNKYNNENFNLLIEKIKLENSDENINNLISNLSPNIFNYINDLIKKEELKLNEENNKIKKDISKYEKKINKLENKKHKNYEKYCELNTNLEKQKENYKDIELKILSYDKQELKEKLKDEVNKLRIIYKEKDELESNINYEYSKLNKEYGRLEQKIQYAKDVLEVYNEEIAETNDYKLIYDYFINNNIVDNLLDKVLVNIENNVNKYLKQMGFNEIEILVDISGSSKVIKIQDKDKLNKALSGRFEKYLLGLLFKQAILKECGDNNLRFLVIDETFDSGDEYALEKMTRFLNSVQEDNIYEFLLVVSHLKLLHKYFDFNIDIKKNEDDESEFIKKINDKKELLMFN